MLRKTHARSGQGRAFNRRVLSFVLILVAQLSNPKVLHSNSLNCGTCIHIGAAPPFSSARTAARRHLPWRDHKQGGGEGALTRLAASSYLLSALRTGGCGGWREQKE